MVVSYLASTSNHNPHLYISRTRTVVSYLASTSNHNARISWPGQILLFLILHLHQTTTFIHRLRKTMRCFLSCIYIKPQLASLKLAIMESCFLSCIYIKPQLGRNPGCFAISCFLSCIYIKPQLSYNHIVTDFVVSYLASTSNHN